MNDGLVVMLAALNLEYEAVRERLADLQVHRHAKGTRFEVGTLSGTACRVALALVGKGNHASAVLAERAIDEFSPVAVVFVGVAGALWPSIALGDVVVATHVYAYHGGTSEDDGLKARPRTWPASHATDQIAGHLARTGDWIDRLPAGTPRPTVHFGAIAAGEIVHDSRTSYEAQWIRQHYNDALAIEMEAAGVAQAGHLNSSPVVVVRGISDRADGSKTTSDGANWQPRAARNAAAFATRLAEELIKEGETTAMEDSRTPAAGGTVHNVATGSNVGIQAAHVTGSTVWMNTSAGPPPALDLAAELAKLRDQLAHARASGELDEATYEAAQDEVDIATKASAANTKDDKSQVRLALRRLLGLVSDVADLGAKVAALIAAVGGLS